MKRLFLIVFFITGSIFAQIIDSYSESNYSAGAGYPLYSSESRIGQSFSNSGTNILRSAKFYLLRSGVLNGSVYAKLYAHSGTYGTSSVGTGTALATSDAIPASSISTSIGLISFGFSTSYTLINGVKYVISVEYTGGDGGNYLVVGVDESSPTHSGNASYYTGGWNAVSDKDCIFYVSTEAVATTFVPIITFIE
jgi:hypothetical protein